MEGTSGETNFIIIICSLKFIIEVSSSTICLTKMSSLNTLITLSLLIYEIFKGYLFDAGVEKMSPAFFLKTLDVNLKVFLLHKTR